MCSRYKINQIAKVIEAMLATPDLDDVYRLPLDFQPGKNVPIVIFKDDKRMIGVAKWGFVPLWAEEKPKTKPFNARSETVATSGLYRAAFKSSRCLMPASGFYEGQGPKGMKHRPQYYFHRPEDEMFALAGVWSRRKDGSTVAMLTTTPNRVVAPIHDRMPVVLQPSDYGKWLDPLASVQDLQMLLRPAPDGDLVCVPPELPKVEPSLFD